MKLYESYYFHDVIELSTSYTKENVFQSLPRKFILTEEVFSYVITIRTYDILELLFTHTKIL